MKRKGFTLIELLAVIVVLAIIALIAVPIVLNIIEDSRRGAAEQSAVGYVHAVENTIMVDMLDDKYLEVGTYNYDKVNVDVNGARPISGTFTVNDKGSVVEAKLCISNRLIEYKNGRSKQIKKGCSIEEENTKNGPVQVLGTSLDTYRSIVYLDPTDLNKTCTESDSVSTSGTKTGCMKWYVFSEDDNNYTMILDHNTINSAKFYNGSIYPVQDELEKLVSESKWEITPRLISEDELKTITGYEDGSSNNGGFYFNSLSSSSVLPKTEYHWLYNYLDTSVVGYWTSTEASGAHMIVALDGGTQPSSDSNTNVGIRPVITVSKSIIGKTVDFTSSKKTCNSNSSFLIQNIGSSTDTYKAIVYLDPTDLCKTCTEKDVVSTTGTKTGCMKWYVYEESDNMYTMILDHNTLQTVNYSSNQYHIRKELHSLLDDSKWMIEPKVISAEEVAKITNNTSYNSSTPNNWFFLDSNNQTQTAKDEGASKYYWLYDYTKDCTNNGCNISDLSTSGYWTSTVVDNYPMGWALVSQGRVYPTNSAGIRPVITINKDLIKK